MWRRWVLLVTFCWLSGPATPNAHANPMSIQRATVTITSNTFTVTAAIVRAPRTQPVTPYKLFLPLVAR